MRAAVCVPFSPATLLHLGSIPNNPRRVSLCNTRCCLVRLQMAHVIHVANVDRSKRPRNAVGVGAARSSAVVCCGCIGRPEVVPNEGHSIPLLCGVSSCTPHAADTHHRHNSHPQHMSSHSLSARQSHGAVGAKRHRHVCPSAQGAAHTPMRGWVTHAPRTTSASSFIRLTAFHQSETISITSC
jgi:hypothetical protein